MRTIQPFSQNAGYFYINQLKLKKTAAKVKSNVMERGVFPNTSLCKEIMSYEKQVFDSGAI